MSGSSVFVGIDVAKAHLDVAALGAKLGAERFENDAEGHTALAAALQPLGVALVVMEATGGYEAALACALQAAGLAVAVVNPKQARDFAKSMGVLPRPTASMRASWPSWRPCWRVATTWRASSVRLPISSSSNWPHWSRAGASC